MKIRNGFVSNSSSSSFVCEICGEIESGMDASYDFFNMVECEKGHLFHRECAMKHSDKKARDIIEECSNEPMEGSLDEKTKKWKEKLNEKALLKTHCPVCQLRVATDKMRLAFLKRTTSDKQILETLRKELKK